MHCKIINVNCINNPFLSKNEDKKLNARLLSDEASEPASVILLFSKSRSVNVLFFATATDKAFLALRGMVAPTRN